MLKFFSVFGTNSSIISFIGDKTYLPPDTFAITYRLRKSPVTPKEEQEILREYPYDVTFVSADFNNGGVCYFRRCFLSFKNY